MKNIYVPIAILIILALLFFNLRSCVRNNKLEKDLKSLVERNAIARDKITTEATIISRQVDKFGIERVTLDAIQNTYSKASVKIPVINVGILDTTAMALNIQKRQIEELTRVITRVNAKNLQTTYIIDSLKRRTVNYNDKFVRIKYTPNTEDSVAGEFDFSYDAALTVVKYNKKKWFLGAKKSFIDISSADPRVKIQGADRFVLEQKPKYFGVNLQAVSFYNGVNNTIGAGAGANIKLGRVNLQPTYLYFPKIETWKPSLQVNYDLIRF